MVELVLLPLIILFLLLLDSLAIIIHVELHLLVELFVVHVAVAALLHAHEGLRLVSLGTGGGAALGTDTDVLCDEVLRGEVLHFISLEIVDILLWYRCLSLFDDFLELVANDIRDLLESLRHAHLTTILSTFVYVDVSMRQLRIQLARYLGCPISDLIANQMNILLPIIDDVIVLLELVDLFVEGHDFLPFFRHAKAFVGVSVGLLLAVVVHLEDVEHLLFLIILLPELV